MMTDQCPRSEEIRSLLLGTLDPPTHQRLMNHVEACQACQDTADTLNNVARDTLVSSLLLKSEDPHEIEPECQQAIKVAQSLRSTDGQDSLENVALTRGRDSAASSAATDEETLALADTQKVGSRLGDMPERFGRYRILKTLGKGGMGAVYLAEDPELDRKLAIKVPFFEEVDKAAILDRFRREARSIAQIHHPNICPIFEASEVNGIPYMAMAFIEGKPLSKFVRPGKPLEIRQVVKLVRLLALTLQHAHEVGVIHRDLKPANIMIDKKNRPVIMDFGLARREGTSETQLTTAGQIIGTPKYMSPEQVSGIAERMGARCDIYSLGVIMYELLTGHVPFSGDLLALLSAIANETAAAPSTSRPEISPQLDAICLKAIAKQAADRFQSMAEFAAALDEYLQPTSPTITMAAAANLTPGNASQRSELESRLALSAASPTGEPQAASVTTPQALLDSNRSFPANNRVADSPRGTSARGRGPLWKPVAIPAAGAGGLLLLLGLIVLLLPGKHGTIRIEINDPDIEVTVSENGYTIKGVGHEEIELLSGEQLLTIKRGDFRFDTDKFVLRKGDKAVVKVEYIDGEITVSDRGTVIGRHVLPAADESQESPGLAAGELRESSFALAFDGKDDYVEIPTLKIPAGPFTVEAIVELASLPPAPKLAMIVSDEGGGFFLSANSKDGFSFLLSRNGRQAGNELPNTSAVGQRIHVSGVFDGNDLILSAHGKRTAHPIGEFSGSKGHVVLGMNPNIRSCFHGVLHELRISKVARYSQKIGPHDRLENDAETIALYHFDEGANELLKDSSGHGHDGKIVGGNWVRIGNPLPSDASTGHGTPPPLAVAPFDAATAKKHQQAWAKHLGVPVKHVNSLGMKFILIPPGEFMMGSTPTEIAAAPKFDGEDDWWQICARSEAPRHEVRLSQPFYLAIHEVTQSTYAQLLGENPSTFSSSGGFKERVADVDTSNFPVENVNWDEAIAFCEKLSREEGLTPFALDLQTGEVPVMEGNGYRLPTEAEWEFACRAGTTTQFWNGDEIEDVNKVGWTGFNSDGRTHKVGGLTANPFGLFDLHGNVWEWVLDRFDPNDNEQFNQSPAVDPWGPETDVPWRSVRGGFWGTPELRCSSSRRYGQPRDQRYGHNGFRIVLTVDAVRQAVNASARVTPAAP